jgi:hypothetical protein
MAGLSKNRFSFIKKRNLFTSFAGKLKHSLEIQANQFLCFDLSPIIPLTIY